MAFLNKGFNEILLFMPMRIKNVLYGAAEKNKCIREIRLRINKPVVIVTDKGCAFIKNTGKLTYLLCDSLVKITKEEFEETVQRISSYSLYSYQDEINQGFITVNGGHRIGICGTAVKDGEKIVSVKNINCLNIRLANEIYGCANKIITDSFGDKLSNIILAGPPNCGKTTVLRDIVRQISNGNAGEYYKCIVVDERNEIVGSSGTDILCDIGENTDVLVNYPKHKAIETAVRTMSPDIIFCDETSSIYEAEQIVDGIMSGVSFVITVHCKNEEDFYKREITSYLNESKMFQKAYFLGTGANVGRVEKIIELGETNENIGLGANFSFNSCNGQYNRQAKAKAN